MWNVTSVLPALRNLLAFVTSLWFAGQHDEELQRQFAARQNLMADIQELTRNYSSELGCKAVAEVLLYEAHSFNNSGSFCNQQNKSTHNFDVNAASSNLTSAFQTCLDSESCILILAYFSLFVGICIGICIGVHTANWWKRILATVSSFCFKTEVRVHIETDGSSLKGHEGSIFKALQSKLSKKMVKMAELSYDTAGVEAVDMAILVVRVPARVSVPYVLGQFQTHMSGNAKQRVIVFMHNMDRRSAEATQPTAKAKADQDGWRELESSMDLVVDLIFDEENWDLQLPQNSLGIDKIALRLLPRS